METSLVEIQDIIQLKRQGLVNALVFLKSDSAGDFRAAQARIETLDMLGSFIEKEVIARRKIKSTMEANA